VQFVEKDGMLANPVMLGLLESWPVYNTKHHLIFLGVLQEVMEMIEASPSLACPQTQICNPRSTDRNPSAGTSF